MYTVVVTDLDGTLLDHHTYDFSPALPALERLRELAIPLVLNSSKTRAEIELWRRRLGFPDPFISENGGAVFIPRDYFPLPAPWSAVRGSYDVIEIGAPYATLTSALREAARESGCVVRAFHEISAEEVAGLCGLPVDEARLAKAREYDEAFEILSHEGQAELLAAISRRGFHWTRGGRFFHILGGSDKARAVKFLRAAYSDHHPLVRIVGLGDALNDAEFLQAVDVPILIPSPQSDAMLRAVPAGRMAPARGPAGWNQAVLDLVAPG